jgi:hypothetical protein
MQQSSGNLSLVKGIFISLNHSICQDLLLNYNITGEYEDGKHLVPIKDGIPIIKWFGLIPQSTNSITLGINPTHRKQLVKIDYKTRTIIEEYKSLATASDMLKLDQSTIINYIKNKTLINDTLPNVSVRQDSFILQYKKDTLHIN